MLKEDVHDFIEKEYLPVDLKLGEPSKMVQDDIQRLINHWKDRKLAKRVPFKFAGFLSKDLQKANKKPIESTAKAGPSKKTKLKRKPRADSTEESSDEEKRPSPVPKKQRRKRSPTPGPTRDWIEWPQTPPANAPPTLPSRPAEVEKSHEDNNRLERGNASRSTVQGRRDKGKGKATAPSETSSDETASDVDEPSDEGEVVDSDYSMVGGPSAPKSPGEDPPSKLTTVRLLSAFH
jgi:hypothetical protein